MVLDDPGTLRDLLCVVPLVAGVAREARGKGVPPVVACELGAQHHDAGRVDATAE